ncbi:MAG: GNAT family N-acetyltransferase [candidate division Zixibacteria bacterium]|nr:GNAT family N-acetyltransferase [candidate division Zixibacteria bacterium]
MEIVYRNLKPEDYDSLIELWEISGLPLRRKGRDSRENMIEYMKREPDFLIGAFDENKLVGVVIATSDLRKGWINRLAVHPKYRRHGIASELLKISEERLIKSGVEIISCLIMDDNQPSICFFQSEGYSSMREVLYFRKVLHPEV